jgi:hypothetical protein
VSYLDHDPCVMFGIRTAHMLVRVTVGTGNVGIIADPVERHPIELYFMFVLFYVCVLFFIRKRLNDVQLISDLTKITRLGLGSDVHCGYCPDVVKIWRPVNK